MPVLPFANNLKIHFLDPRPGASPAVLLLHGLGADCTSWSLQFDALTEAGYRPIAPDARGFGQSTFPGGTVRIETMAADMAALLSALEIDRADIVGISLGGMVALALALAFPENVNRLVLANTAAWLLPGDLRTWLYYTTRLLVLMALGIPSQARLVSRRIFPEPDQAPLRALLESQILQADPSAYRATMLALARFDVRGRLGEISTPTLVVTGDRDTTISPNRQQQLAAGITGARQVTIPAAGHAVTVEKPGEFNHLLLEFLAH